MTSEYLPSPVPSDRDPWPGELPFTAFGQWGYGRLDKRVFEQDVYWVDVRGKSFLLTEMTDEYRWGVITFLFDNVDHFYRGAVERMFSTIEGDARLGRVNADVLTHAVGGATIVDLEPVEWLESTPLMRRLRVLTQTFDAQDEM